MKHAQLIARLEYVSHLASWLHTHAEMKPALVGLMKRGLVYRDKSDEAIGLTEKGQKMLDNNKHLISAEKWQNGQGYNTLVIGADYWTDQWNQKIPH